jgi:beta-glucanase (GH16 family)
MMNPALKILLLLLGFYTGGALLAGADAVDPTSAGAVPSVPEIASQGYTLAFSDEFNGTALDQAKWDYRIDSKALSTQLPANVTVSGGMLHLALKKEASAGKDYTGAGVISKATFQYGYYEARYKVPPGAGWHTSFWTMLYDKKGTGPQGSFQEIDICEQNSKSHTGYSTDLHNWASPKHESVGYKFIKTSDLASDFHVYGAEFTPTVVNMYFDGKLVNSFPDTSVIQGQQNIWLTSIGYKKPMDDTKLPSEAVFDYVRFFTKK